MNATSARSKEAERAGAKRRPHQRRQHHCHALVRRSAAGRDHTRWGSVAIHRGMVRDFRLFVNDPLKLHAHHRPVLVRIRILVCMSLIIVIVLAHVTLAGFLGVMVGTLMNNMSNLQVVAVISRFVMMA